MEPHSVVVAGAGPVGLVAALALARRGIDVTVLEMRARPNAASKASTFHPPTLDILDRLGVFEVMQAQAQRVESVQYRTPHAVLGALPYRLLEGHTRHALRMHFEQSRLTPLLLEQLQRMPGAHVWFDSEVLAAQTQANEVVLRIRQGSTESGVRARFLIGADGAHSRVRQSLGIAFEGHDYPGMALRVRTDHSIEALLPGLAAVSYLVDDPRSASFLKMPDCWRVILRVPAEVSEDQCLQDDWILGRLKPLIPTMRALPRILGKDCYRAGRYLARRMQQGRIVLAGDSAHITNTRGGMNMNAGIHDAWMLAHAIAEVLGGAPMATLDQTVADRERIARDKLLPRTDTMVSDPGRWIDRVSHLLQDDTAGRRYLSEAAMLDMVNLSPIGERASATRTV